MKAIYDLIGCDYKQNDYHSEVYDATYCDLSIPIVFTGRLRIACTPIKRLFINACYGEAAAFRVIYDIETVCGKIINVKNMSTVARKTRAFFREHYGKNYWRRGIYLDIDEL